MPTQTLSLTATAEAAFPAADVKRRLWTELEKVADDGSRLRPEWEPLLDSQRVVGTVLVIEDMFPSCKIAPDKVVRKGGYNSVKEAVDDISARIERIVTRRNEARVEK